MQKRVAIIGAGAAGLMTAAALSAAIGNAQRSATLLASDKETEIFLIERNSGLGKKVIISGGGRCNVTTGIESVKTVLSKYPRGGKFLVSAMHAFPPHAVYAWFESHGVPLKVEEDLRVFPRSNKGTDVVGVFETLFSKTTPRMHTLLNTSVTGVTKNGKTFEIALKGKEAPLLADMLVLTTGGQAYRHTGSTGDGYAFALSLGHTITPLAPSLNAFFTSEPWPKTVSGLSFEQATIGARGHAYTGPFLFTHKGISGPAVFALSSLVAFESYTKEAPLEITIDLFPDLTLEKLIHTLNEHIAHNPKKSVGNTLAALVPKSLAAVAARELGLAEESRANELSKKDILRVTHWLKKIPLHAIARGAGDEFVTAGGVTLTEVNQSTMESKLCPGLYFAGELLDVDGYTGGFNLQASWATGHLAGVRIAGTL